MLNLTFEPVRVSASALARLASLGPQGAASSLREWAVAVDRGGREVLPLGELWRQLSNGSFHILDSFWTAERCYLVLHEQPPLERLSSERRSVAILEQVLLHGCQKVVALELGLSASSVALHGRRALEFMGLGCRISETPFFLVAAAAAFHRDSANVARSVELEPGRGPLRTVSLARPDLYLHTLLSPALVEVTRAFVEGKRRRRIASERESSERTVANQLSHVFATLRATGRLDLLRVLTNEPRQE